MKITTFKPSTQNPMTKINKPSPQKSNDENQQTIASKIQ
jgi:hypothetical protein